MVLGYLLTIAALVLVVLALFTVLAYYYSRSQQCATNPNIWCWSDWTCPAGLPGPTSNVLEATYGLDSPNLSDCFAAGNSSCLCDWASSSPSANTCLTEYCKRTGYSASGVWQPFTGCSSAPVG